MTKYILILLSLGLISCGDDRRNPTCYNDYTHNRYGTSLYFTGHTGQGTQCQCVVYNHVNNISN